MRRYTRAKSQERWVNETEKVQIHQYQKSNKRVGLKLGAASIPNVPGQDMAYIRLAYAVAQKKIEDMKACAVVLAHPESFSTEKVKQAEAEQKLHAEDFKHNKIFNALFAAFPKLENRILKQIIK